MIDLAKRLFVGIKISQALQIELDCAAPGTKHYFDGNGDKDYLEIVSMGEDQFVGRYIKDGFSAAGMTDASRNICSIVKLIARGRSIDERDVHIYAC
jgi:hypothetical protein